MEAFRFEAVIQENGIIQIPEISKFANREVDIFIVVRPSPKLQANKQYSVNSFLDKWKGMLKGFDPDKLKTEYLQEKYG